MKKQLEGVKANQAFRNKYFEVVQSLIDPTPEMLRRVDRWFYLQDRYLEYFARGGGEILREAAIKHIAMDEVGRLAKAAAIGSFADMAPIVHDVNWRLIRSKHWPEGHRVWEAELDAENEDESD